MKTIPSVLLLRRTQGATGCLVALRTMLCWYVEGGARELCK